MPIMCPNCFSIRKVRYRSKLHCLECHEKVVEIDELFVLPISILNKKGYRTRYCCSGHLLNPEQDYPDAYIFFQHGIDIPYFPNRFEYDNTIFYPDETESVCIRRYFKHDSLIDMQKDILQSALDVLEWAESLPDKKENKEN